MSSEIFTLIAQGGRSFFVHSSILAAQSQPFRSIISGDWKESSERKISLEDWDSDTVGRFIEFLYTGNYQYPEPEPLSPERVAENEASKKEEPEDTGLRMIYKDKGLNQNRPLTPLGKCIQPGLRRKRENMDEEERLKKFDPGQHDYKATLLTHAKVYALAQYKDVTTLRSLSLERLLATLMTLGSVEHGSHIAINVVELLGYVYSHTDAPTNYEEPMRRIVSQFAALNFPALQTREEMMVLMSEGGDLVRDLMEKVCRRLVVSEGELLEERSELAVFKCLWGETEKELADLKLLKQTVDDLREKLIAAEKEVADLRPLKITVDDLREELRASERRLARKQIVAASVASTLDVEVQGNSGYYNVPGRRRNSSRQGW